MKNALLLLQLVLLYLGCCLPSTMLFAQKEAKDKTETANKKDKKKTYQDFITAKAISQTGMLSVHEVDGK